MPISYRPIVPKKMGLRRLHQLYGQFAQVMGDFATESHDELATYPPQKAETRTDAPAHWAALGHIGYYSSQIASRPWWAARAR